MKDIVFKVAPRGEGKTKWLLNVANESVLSGHDTYIATRDDSSYVKFCEKYFSSFGDVCPVKRFEKGIVSSNEVVLIDNFLEQEWTTYELEEVHKSCYQLFITVEGRTDYVFPLEFEQLTMEV